MIIVANTKEFERKYDLNNLRDEELIMIEGGLKGKNKYNKEHYKTRTTYTVRTLKKIIQQMKMIESKIPKEWDEFQKAKYIYTVLGKNIEYEHDKEKHVGGRCSNLTGLITGKSICAGYSLIFKEMMDRQGIQCDYIRGLVGNKNKTEKHAWNVLTIQGKSFPVDLTWDSARLNNGISDLEYFGTDSEFFKVHAPEEDEKKYKYTTLNKKEVNAIDIYQYSKNKEDISELKKKNAISYAIEKTYLKFENVAGTEYAIKGMKKNLKRYITENNENVFTRDEGARAEITEKVTVDDMIRIISESYVMKNRQGERKNVLEKGIEITAKKYGAQNARAALEKYIKTGYTKGFTRDENARDNIKNMINNETALEMIISDFVNEQIRQIQNSKENEKIIETKAQKYFDANEFIAVNLPERKNANIIKKAIAWIKEKAQIIPKNKIENKETSKEKDDNLR